MIKKLMEMMFPVILLEKNYKKGRIPIEPLTKFCASTS
jgi:hypothetical protein